MKEFLQNFITLIQAYGIPGLIALSFAESSFFPIPPDLLLIPMAFMNRNLAIFYALITTAASVIGGILGHKLGKILGRPILYRFFCKDRITKVEVYFSNYGGWAIAIAGFTPIPYKIFTISAGVFDIRISVLVVASIIGRGARFFLEGSFIFFFGDVAKYYLSNYFELITVIITLICIMSYLVWKLLKRRKLVLGTGVAMFLRRKYNQVYNWIIKYRAFDTAVFYFFTNIAISIISLVLFSELVEDYFERGSWSFDNYAYECLKRFSSTSINNILKAASTLGNPIAITILIIIACIILLYLNKKKEVLLIILNVPAVWTFNIILKSIFKMPRLNYTKPMQVSSFGFPNTQAMVILAIAVLMMYFILLFTKKKYLAYFINSLILLLTILMGIGRVYFGLDYFSDVIAGWTEGILWASTSIGIHRVLIHKKPLIRLTNNRNI